MALLPPPKETRRFSGHGRLFSRGLWASPPVQSGVSRIGVLAVSAAILFASTRLVIAYGGPSTFAYMTLVASMMALIPVADLGTGAAVTNVLAEEPGDIVESEAVQRTVLTALRVLIATGAMLGLLSLTINIVGGWPVLLGLPQAGASQLSMSVSMAFLAFSVALPLGIGQRLLLGIGRNHVAVLCQVAGPVLTITFVSLVAWLELDPAYMAGIPGIALLGTGILTTLVAARVTRLPLADLLMQTLAIRKRRGVSIRRSAGPMIIISLALPIAFQSDRLVLSHYSTTAELATYSLAAQLYAPFWAVLSAAGMSLWPMFTKSRSARQSARVQLYISILGLVSAASLGGMTLVLLGPWAGHLLSAGVIQLDWLVLAAFAVLLLVQAAHTPSGMALTDHSGLRVQALTVVSMLIVNLTLSITLTPVLGASGPVLASVVAVGCCQLIPSFLVARTRVHQSGKESASDLD